MVTRSCQHDASTRRRQQQGHVDVPQRLVALHAAELQKVGHRRLRHREPPQAEDVAVGVPVGGVPLRQRLPSQLHHLRAAALGVAELGAARRETELAVGLQLRADCLPQLQAAVGARRRDDDLRLFVFVLRRLWRLRRLRLGVGAFRPSPCSAAAAPEAARDAVEDAAGGRLLWPLRLGAGLRELLRLGVGLLDLLWPLRLGVGLRELLQLGVGLLELLEVPIHRRHRVARGLAGDHLRLGLGLHELLRLEVDLFRPPRLGLELLGFLPAGCRGDRSEARAHGPPRRGPRSG
eukprot:16452356-Heterocapsa_arctica.AAC.2